MMLPGRRTRQRFLGLGPHLVIASSSRYTLSLSRSQTCQTPTHDARLTRHKCVHPCASHDWTSCGGTILHHCRLASLRLMFTHTSSGVSSLKYCNILGAGTSTEVKGSQYSTALTGPIQNPFHVRSPLESLLLFLLCSLGLVL